MEIKTDSSLTTSEIPVTQPNSAIPSTQTSQPAPTSGQPTANVPAPEADDWVKDERHKRMWNQKGVIFTPEQNQVLNGGLYKSYRELEKHYTPLKTETETLKKQMNEIGSICKEYGLELNPQELKGVLDELKSFKTDDEKLLNPTMAIGKAVEPWVNDPVYGEKLDKVIKEWAWEKLQATYPGMTLPQIQAQEAMKQELETIKSQLKSKEDADLFNQQETALKKGLEEIKSYSQEIGFAFTDDIKNTLLDYCMKNRIPTEYVYETFLKVYKEETRKAYAEKVKQEQLQNMEKNKNQVTIPAGAQAPVSTGKTGKEGLIERLRNVKL